MSLVVDATSHTRVILRCGCAGCGNRVQILPDAFATSMAATRFNRISWSGSWISSGSRDMPPGSMQTEGGGRSPVGHGREPRNLTGVLEATVCDPSRSGPAPDSLTASSAKITAASAGDLTTVFHAIAACPAQGDSLVVDATSQTRVILRLGCV